MSRGLFIQAPSLLLNPTLSQERIDAEIAEDPEGARSEWGGLFREDVSQFLEDALIDQAVVPGRIELPYQSGRQYTAFCDPSGGRHDAMTLSVAHAEKAQGSDATRIVLDRLLIQRPPFEPETVVRRFVDVLREFHLSTVTGDRYGAAWVEGAFKKCGVTYTASELDKPAIYLAALPLFAQHRVELLDIPRLLTELRLLERTPRSGGRSDNVDHPRGGWDDCANSCCGALVLAAAEGAGAAYTHGIMHNVRNEDERMPFRLAYRMRNGFFPF